MRVAGGQNGPVPFHWPCSTEDLACADIQDIRISDVPSLTDASREQGRDARASRAEHEWTSLARHRSGAGCLCRLPLAAFRPQSAVSADGSVLSWIPAFSTVFGLKLVVGGKGSVLVFPPPMHCAVGSRDNGNRHLEILDN